MGSAVKNVSPRRHSNLGKDAGLLYPHSSVKGSLATGSGSLIAEETRPSVVTKLFKNTLALGKVQVNEGVAPRMWSTAIVAVNAQRDGDQKGVTDPYAVLLGNERSEAESARASGEAHRGKGRESADGLTAPPLTQESGNVQELLCPKQTQSLGLLAPIDGSASQVHRLTETPGHNFVFGPPAVTEPSAVEDSSSPASNDSEATTPGASCTEGQPGVYSNLGHDSSIIITTDINEKGAPYPVTSSITGDPADSLGTCGVLLESSAETNVITPVSGSDGRGSSSYENAAIVCEETSCMKSPNRQSRGSSLV